jgi:uncharacterized membrane protein
MNQLIARLLTTVGTGLLIIAPVYLSILLLLKALSTIQALLAPIVAVLPEGLRNESLAAVVFLLAVGLAVGWAVRTVIGKRISDAIERSIYARIPGYSIFRSLTRRVAAETDDTAWRSAMVDTDDGALMPVFVIEELPDGRYTVFVPSVPTPLAGAVFIYQSDRVHFVDVPLRQALGVVSRWGEGAKGLVARMQ